MAMFRDIECGQNVSRMMELRRFDSEFMAYGCGYVEDGKIKYRVTSKASELYDFVEKCAAILRR